MASKTATQVFCDCKTYGCRKLCQCPCHVETQAPLPKISDYWDRLFDLVANKQPIHRNLLEELELSKEATDKMSTFLVLHGYHNCTGRNYLEITHART